MLEVVIEVDGRPLSRWGCDGVVCATPTGSTAYAFSAGGPVVWPEVEALLHGADRAHALFARPLVVSPALLAAEVIGAVGGQPVIGLGTTTQPAADGQSETAGAVLWCDGRRMVELPPERGSRCGAAASRCCWRGCPPWLTLPAVAARGPAGGAHRGAVHRPAGGEVRPARAGLARPAW